MAINVKSILADGEVFRRNGADIDGVTLRDGDDSATVTLNTATAGIVEWDVNPQLPIEAVRLNGAARVTSARLATIAALPACTYNNGTSGVGATLTGDANGALADQDFTTPAAGDVIVVMNQAAPLQNGIYEVTTLGTAGTPFVLTRTAEADQAADFTTGIVVLVASGLTQKGRILTSSPTTVVMGTTGIRWRTPAQPATFRTVDSDFDEFTAAVTTSGQAIPGTKFGATFTGTSAQVSQASGAAPSVGVANLETGTTAAGCVFIGRGHFMGGGYSWDTAAPAEFWCRVSVPTVSTLATQEFWSAVGWIVATVDPQRHHLTSGAYFEFPTDGSGSNVYAVTRQVQSAQTSQAWTRSSATITVTTTAHGLEAGDPVTISATSDAAALPNTSGATGYIVLTTPTADTFTILGFAAGGASGTATVTRSTSTRTDTGLAGTGTGYRSMAIRYTPEDLTFRFYSGTAMNLVATHTTDLPAATTSLLAAATIQKQIGTTSRSLYIDRIVARHLETRTLMGHIPV